MTKHGNLRLRAALVELAWRLMRFQPASRRTATRLNLWRLHIGRATAEQLGLHS